MNKVSKFLKLLVSKGLVSDKDLHDLTHHFREDAHSLLKYLIAEGVAQQRELGTLWGDFTGFPYIDLGKTLFQNNIVELLPQKFARKNKIIFIYKLGEAITAAMADPNNSTVREEAQRITKMWISPVFAFPEEIDLQNDVSYVFDEEL